MNCWERQVQTKKTMMRDLAHKIGDLQEQLKAQVHVSSPEDPLIPSAFADLGQHGPARARSLQLFSFSSGV